MTKIRVLLVDDSKLARGLLRSFLESDPDIEVVGEAGDGQEAIELARELKPNLITMDLEMPVMGGVQAIEEIMATKAVPILVVSGVADAHNAYAAVSHGALEVIGKPECDAQSAADFVAKVKLLAGVPVITHLRARLRDTSTSRPDIPPPAQIAAPAAPDGDGGYRRVFAIASSTGGPQALALILASLPANFPSPVLISQHIYDGFAEGMVAWLGGLCKLPVRLGREGEPIAPGVVYISPSESNMAATPSRRIALRERGARDIYHPVCNVLLESAAEVFRQQAVGIILTGMGSDGAVGIAAVRMAGGSTVAQDEASSVIFGMNKVAIDNGNVQQVLPLSGIAAEMCRLAGVLMPAGAGSA